MNRRIRIAGLVILLTVGVSLFAAEISAHVQGKWQASWTGRLGSEPVMLILKQHGAKLSGKLLRASDATQLSGTVVGNEISFLVNFPGVKPYSILFKGTVKGDSIQGTSQAQNVGTSSAYLGHGGEIVQPDHPWTATRIHADRQQVAKAAQ